MADETRAAAGPSSRNRAGRWTTSAPVCRAGCGRLGDDPSRSDHSRPPDGTGVANETLLFDVSRSDGTTDGFVARLATPDPLYLDYDLSMHYRMYETMMSVPSVPTPAVVGYEADPSIVGSDSS